MAFPHEQFDPEEVYQVTLDVLTGKDTAYRHVLPASTVDDIRAQTESQWDRLLNDGRRPETAQAAYDLQPATRVSTHTD